MKKKTTDLIREKLSVFKGKDFELTNRLLDQRNLRDLADIVSVECTKMEAKYSKLLYLRNLMDTYL